MTVENPSTNPSITPDSNSDSNSNTNSDSNSPFIPKLPRASFSRLSIYRECPRKYKFKYIDKLPEPDRPIQRDRSGKPKASAAERGSWIHDQMDHYINDRSPRDIQLLQNPNTPEEELSADTQPIRLLPELLNIKAEVEELKALKKERPNNVHTEQKWYFDMDWDIIEDTQSSTPTQSPSSIHNTDYAVVAIVDCMIIDDYSDPDFVTARVIDLKSGKSYNNASKHALQLNLYAAAAAYRFPEIQEFSLELFYCDEGLIKTRQVTRDHAITYGNYWSSQILKMHKDQYYDHQAHATTCRFCPYGALPDAKINGNKWVNRSGDCEYFIEHTNDTKWRELQESRLQP